MHVTEWSRYHILHSLKHVAIIMDGNRRWAENNGKLSIFGYKNGVRSVRKAVNFAMNQGIKTLTLYAFSQENWGRSSKEVSALMKLFLKVLKNDIYKIHKNNIRLRIFGDKSRFSINLQNYIQYSELLTSTNKGLNLNIAVNYSGHWDIVQGVKKLAKKVKKGTILPEQIDQSVFDSVICTNKISPIDLLIRTGGEFRISNFLLWQIVYTEFFFTNVLWPDFNEKIFKEAINAFFKRKRRFGKD